DIDRSNEIEYTDTSGAENKNDDIHVEEQFQSYFRFQENYTEHNSSNTIHERPDEWNTAQNIVYSGWDNFVGVSFLAYDGGSYELSPYEAITKEDYEKLAKDMTKLDSAILEKYETGEDSDLEGMDGCEGGICPIR